MQHHGTYGRRAFLTPAIVMGCLILAWTLPPAGAAPTKPPAARRAFELRMAGHAGRAKAVLRAALAQDATDASAQFELARVCFYLLELDSAQQAIEQAAKLRPQNAQVHYWAGLIAEYRAVWQHKDPKTRSHVPQQMKRALAAFRKAVAINPEYHEARVALVNVYVKNPPRLGGSRRKAKKHAKALEAADAVQGARARSLLLGSRLDERRALWQKVVAECADHAGAHEGLGWVCLRMGDKKKGLAQLNRALELDPSRSEILVDLTRHYAMAKQYAQAERTIRRYLDLKPAPPVPMRAYATFCAAKIQKMQANHQRADALLAEAKKLHPDSWMFFRQPPQALFAPPPEAHGER